ncbi:hypothetical protein GCM10008171_10390 [Methylopila jiangsuensis]|uniref:Lectin-like protein BA14k n=1 Tax=Methylopila jiangsuensis TaxID=586230 RepID=A0A9W6JH79_9HYPH|nr:hypothetical protein [Methylopila jiangsuensis]MDR6286027.1 hypothetical protein [Methylopila jiangsuensis]GLK75785.1 hypothetical protein GCM10008171_10390 [Methylopila jiangsuensis]
MSSVLKRTLAVAGVLGVALAAVAPAQAAWVGSPAAVEQARTAQAQLVDWRDRRYGGGYRHHHHRGDRAAGYAAAGVLGLAAGALIAGSASRDRYDYEDDYYAPRRVYVERPRYYNRCKVVRWGEDRWGEPVRVVTYRPC